MNHPKDNIFTFDFGDQSDHQEQNKKSIEHKRKNFGETDGFQIDKSHRRPKKQDPNITGQKFYQEGSKNDPKKQKHLSMDRVVPEGQLGNNLLASQKMTWTYENDAYSKEPTMVKEKNPTRNRQIIQSQEFQNLLNEDEQEKSKQLIKELQKQKQKQIQMEIREQYLKGLNQGKEKKKREQQLKDAQISKQIQDLLDDGDKRKPKKQQKKNEKTRYKVQEEKKESEIVIEEAPEENKRKKPQEKKKRAGGIDFILDVGNQKNKKPKIKPPTLKKKEKIKEETQKNVKNLLNMEKVGKGQDQIEKLQQWNEKKNKKKQYDDELINKLAIKNQQEKEDLKSSIKQYDLREHTLNLAKKKLLDNASIIWIFLIQQDNLNPSNKQKIKAMYQGSLKDYLVPICLNLREVQKFLDIPNAFFKIVADLQNIHKVLQYRDLSKILEYYIYNEKGQQGVKQALNYKRKYKKIKGISFNLQKILERVEDEVDYEVLLKEQKNLQGETKIKNAVTKTRFPSFLKLSGEDKADATMYRINLYGAMNMPDEDRVYRYMDFMNFVYEKQFDKPAQKKHIDYYGSLKHLDGKFDQQNEDRCRKIINFYTRQTFYYRTLNAMLRTIKNPDQFKICSIPFNENYHAVKYFYKKLLKKNKRKLESMKVYRGVRNLKPKDIERLKAVKKKQDELRQTSSSSTSTNNELYIEMYGFLSTSKNEAQSRNFLDKQDGILFVIHIPEMIISQEYEDYDHGFVDMNAFNISEIETEEQVLFNPLNIFRVKGFIQKKKDGKTWTQYHLQYGVIFDLLLKKRNQQLTVEEEDILINYQYCTELQKKIEDEGDVFLLANDPEASKQYYENKKREIEKKLERMKENQEKQGQQGLQNKKLNEEKVSQLGKACLKLAVIHHQIGELDQAQENAKKALEVLQQNIDKGDKQKCLKVFGIHSKNAQINVENEDYLQADKDLENGMEYLQEETEEDLLKKGKAIRERGQIKFKKGEVNNAENDFGESQELFEKILTKTRERQREIQTSYWKKVILGFACCGQKRQQIQVWREEQELQIRKEQDKIERLRKQIQNELMKVNDSIREVAIYVEDKSKYEVCVTKARGYLAQMKASATNDPFQKAKLKVVQATVKTYLKLAESEIIIQQAIKLIQDHDPFHEDVGKYCQTIAKIQKNHLDKLTNPKAALQVQKENEEKQEMTQSNYKQQQNDLKQTYKKCQKNYQKAINILLFHQKSKNSKEVLELQNQLVQLRFNTKDFKNCENLIHQIRQEQKKGEKPRSEHAKASLLLSKISYCRGQLKLSFQIIQQVKITLKDAIVKNQQNEQYVKLFKRHDIYIESQLQRSKIYSKQLRHDLALKDVNDIYDVIKEKFNNSKANPYISQIHLYKGQIKANASSREKNDQVKKTLPRDYHFYFKEAISTVQRQRGMNNSINASIYCSYIQSLLIKGDLENSKKTLRRVAQIVSTLPLNHPTLWPVFFCYGQFEQKNKNYKDSLVLLKNCLKVMEGKFDSTHISISKVKLQYTQTLSEAGDEYDEQYERQYKNLNLSLEEQLKNSSLRASFVRVSEMEKEEENEDMRNSSTKIRMSVHEQREDQKQIIRQSLYQINKRRQMRRSIRLTNSRS